MPSLRLDHGDLKCKNGCEYFGNPQWQGYCSKCHREQMQRQRRAEKATASSSATLPKAEPKKPAVVKLTSHSSFSKFEEKRQRRSDTLKKANLLNFRVFKKSSEEHDQPERKQPEFKIPASVNEGMKREFRARFRTLGAPCDRDTRVFAHSLIADVVRCAPALPVDELSERVQRQYQRFMKHMDTSPHFAGVDSDTKELLMDFVEKHAMSYLHELPSVVFSPPGTDDERLDRVMSERIQQLSWVGEKHLECKLDKSLARCQLLYKAISELLGVDSASSPGGKLSRVRRACRHVLSLCREAPASADDLLPALIFTVLKANPPRLVSNINFVTRFCNAQRLMTGEGGYYFTNLCCAVSFIENLTAESLNMDKVEFDCYMSMPATIGGSSWACALSLCGAAHEADTQRAAAERALKDARELHAQADKLAHDAHTFEEQITKKVQDVLSKTPLEIKPRRLKPRFDEDTARWLVDIDIPPPHDIPTGINVGLNEPVTVEGQNAPAIEKPSEPIERQTVKKEEIKPINFVIDLPKPTEKEEKLTILGFEEVERPSMSKSPQNLDHSWDLKQSNSLDLLTPSPLGFTQFDSRSIDELMTPDEFGSEHLAPGLSNINYDIDLSDFSGDNSIAEDAKADSKDPFSPEGIQKGTLDPFTPQASKEHMKLLEAFDEFSLVDSKNRVGDSFEVVHRDPFSPIGSKYSTVSKEHFNPNKKEQPDHRFSPELKTNDSFSPVEAKVACIGDPFSPVLEDPFTSPFYIEKDAASSLLDDSNSPTSACLLPSPLQPQNNKKT